MHPFWRIHLLIFPPACRQCGGLMNPWGPAHAGFPFLCAPCRAGLPWKPLSHSCRQCGAPTAEPDHLRCPRCADKTFALERVWCAFQYSEPVRQWIWALKFQGQESYSKMLGGLMASHFPHQTSMENADLMLPVPLHRRRLRKRGFNQSYLLAAAWRNALRAEGRRTPVLETDLLVRHRYTRPQMEVSRQEREINVADAFSLGEKSARGLEGKRVLLVDDLLTSGATLNACARTLLEGGATAVEALVLARA